MYDTLLKFLFWVALTIFIISIVTMLTSCNSLGYRPPVNNADTSSIIRETIYKTDWLTSMFLLSIVLSIFVGLNGVKAGWLGAIAAYCGLLLKMAISNTWLWVAAGIFFLVMAGVAVFTVFIKNKALKEIISNIQIFKDKFPKELATHLLKEELNEQSSTTKKLVKKVKEKL